MKLKHYSADKLKKDVLNIVSKHLDLDEYRIFFFGSRIKGTNFAGSDIDIGVEGPKEIDPAIKINIEEELEKLPILYKIDFVDFKQVSDKFRKEALQYREFIN